MPLALYSFGTSANLRKFIGHRLKPCITTNLHTADFSAMAMLEILWSLVRHMDPTL